LGRLINFSRQISDALVDPDVLIGDEKRGQLSAFGRAERPCVLGVYAAELLAAQKHESFDHVELVAGAFGFCSRRAIRHGQTHA
jgi:hypothetical protein